MLLKTPNGDYPRFLGDLWLEHPDYKEGEPLPDGWVQVEYTPRPEVDEDSKAVEIEPVLQDGVLYQAWEIQPLTEYEITLRDAPKNAKQKLMDLGLTEFEIQAIANGMVR